MLKWGLLFSQCQLFLVKLQGAQLQNHINASLGSGNLREAVRLPPGEDIYEWLAVNSKIHHSPYRFPSSATMDFD